MNTEPISPELMASLRKTHQSLVEIDLDACQRVASFLSNRTIPIDRENIGIPNLSVERVGNFYFFAVAICHQTSPWDKPSLSGAVNGKHSQGWDYLTARLQAAVNQDSDLLTPSRWATITRMELADLFDDPEMINPISDPDGRSALVRDLGRRMKAAGWSSLSDIFSFCQGRIGGVTPNLMSELAGFKAYTDPVRKKSFFLLSIMRNLGLWSYQDEEHLGAPVDYHEVRGHLRLGTVTVLDPSLREKLLLRQSVTHSEDVAIRQAVLDAIMCISDMLGHSPSQLHYLFWNVFRSCCGRDVTHCEGCPDSCSLPDPYKHLSIQHGKQACSFAHICPSRKIARRYTEHVVATEYY